jgi:hypothetical protein
MFYLGLMPKTILFIFALPLFLSSTFCYAQSLNETKETLSEAFTDRLEVRIEVKGDGNTYIGYISLLTETEVTIYNDSGRFTFRLESIKEVRLVDPENLESRWF